jgi:hypothetical protein
MMSSPVAAVTRAAPNSACDPGREPIHPRHVWHLADPGLDQLLEQRRRPRRRIQQARRIHFRHDGLLSIATLRAKLCT